MLHPFDAEYAWRLELERWRSFLNVRFDRAAWDANLTLMGEARFYPDRYPGQIPPWVIVTEPAPTTPAKTTRKRSKTPTL